MYKERDYRCLKPEPSKVIILLLLWGRSIIRGNVLCPKDFDILRD
jgi:hypothetical protein